MFVAPAPLVLLLLLLLQASGSCWQQQVYSMSRS
jgi:hypothetical protein